MISYARIGSQIELAPKEFVAPRNDGRFVHNATFSYRPPFRYFRYHPNTARSPLKPIETASGC